MERRSVPGVSPFLHSETLIQFLLLLLPGLARWRLGASRIGLRGGIRL